MLLVHVISFICVQLKNNCTGNSQVIVLRKAECNIDCYKYNYSLIALKHMWLPNIHATLTMMFPPHP